jgi:hypothetical protein
MAAIFLYESTGPVSRGARRRVARGIAGYRFHRAGMQILRRHAVGRQLKLAAQGWHAWRKDSTEKQVDGLMRATRRALSAPELPQNARPWLPAEN